jgi:hypothetical protein
MCLIRGRSLESLKMAICLFFRAMDLWLNSKSIIKLATLAACCKQLAQTFTGESARSVDEFMAIGESRSCGFLQFPHFSASLAY